jgi:hypothetical protein
MTSSFPRPKPKPGSLPLERKEELGPPHFAQFAIPPFIAAGDFEPKSQPRKPTPRSNLVKLKTAAKKVEKLRSEVRDDAFDEWVRRCVLDAQGPREWTQAAVLYASYEKRAREYGWNRADRRLLKLELASETRFGILLRDAGFPKQRRAKGHYYPLKLKRGA